MRYLASLFVLILCAASVNAQKFDRHKVYLANNGIDKQIVKVNPALSFSIKKDNRVSWAKYKIDNDEVSFSATTNTTSKIRRCDFILVDNNGNHVDTLEVLQAGRSSITSNKNVARTVSSTSSNKQKSKYRTVRKSSSRNSYGGQCAATTRKGRRCSRQASSGSIYCWQHQ